MTTTGTLPWQRIERTRYGEPRHETTVTNEKLRYGEPQHDVERWESEELYRIAYEDDHWAGGSTSDGNRPAAEETVHQLGTLA